jgi:peptide/nickel transport system substrate-binding protein
MIHVRSRSAAVATSLCVALILAVSLGAGSDPAQAAQHTRASLSAHTALSCSGAKEGGSMTFGVPQDVIGFDPTNTQDVQSLSVQLQIFDQLLRYPPNSKKLTGDLATSWKVTNGGRMYTLQLRHNARFSDGEPVTAQDVVASFHFLGRKTAVVNWTLAVMKSVKAIGKYTVQITLKKPSSPFGTDLTLWGASIFPAKVLKSESAEQFRQHPVGSGPYYMAKWVPGNYVLLKRNKYYWGHDACGHQLPYLDSVKLVVVPDDNTRVTRLTSGSLDTMINIPYNLIKTVNSSPNTHAGVTSAGNCIVYALNTHYAPFKDVNVTQAMNYAVDRDAIVKAVFYGAANPSLSMLPKGALYYTPKYGYHYNLAKAKALMKKSKFPNGFKVEQINVAGNTANQEIAVIMQNELKQIGITMTIRPLDATAEFSAIKKESYQMATLNCTSQTINPDTNQLFCCVSWGGADANYTGWKDAKSDQLFRLTESTLEQAQIQKYYAQYQKIVMENGPNIWMVNPSNTFGYRSNIHGFTQDFTAHWNLWTVWKG